MLSADLIALLDDTFVDTYPLSDAIDFDYFVNVQVLSMRGRLDEQAHVTARWTIYRGDDKANPIAVRIGQYVGDVEGPGYKHYVVALRIQLRKLAEDIAKAIGEAPGRG